MPLIGVVGPCAAGKTTLIQALKAQGITARHIAQEHSFVPTMWQKITNPDVLIFLDVSYPESLKRRKMNWNESEYLEQRQRLAHALAHADFYINTDSLPPTVILEQVIAFLEKHYPTLRQEK
uniref:NadR/Ttd14 AAA domain-containing protein n=1 Tax=Anaerolinea thermolimosa TaxID=229919 RepID=A0A7C4PJS3_9CHLR